MVDFRKLKSILLDLDIKILKTVLGETLVHLLIEWTKDDEKLFNKELIVEIILSTYGIDLLKNLKFRHIILSGLDKKDILSFKDYLGSKYKNDNNLGSIVDRVATIKWGNNNITKHLIEKLELNIDLENYLNYSKEPSISFLENKDIFYELLDYQFIIKQKLLNHLNSSTELDRMLVHMPTGTGKTKTAMHTLINYYTWSMNKTGLVIWMAHNKELLNQAINTFKNTWKHIGQQDVCIYKLWGDFSIHDRTLNGILFCSFQKLISLYKLKPGFFRKIRSSARLIVVDEAHKSTAKQTKIVIENLMTKTGEMMDRSLIGLTATPGRSLDNSQENIKLTNMFDKKIITIEPELIKSVSYSKSQLLNSSKEKDIIKYLQKRRILSKLKREELKYTKGISNYELSILKKKTSSYVKHDFTKEQLQEIGRNRNRNIAILDRLVQLSKEKKPVILFACSIEHGYLLSASLSLQNIESACIFGDTDKKLRNIYIDRFRDKNDKLNILINYEVLTTGFDSTNIECVFITRPTQSIVLYSQMIGRGLRGPMMGGQETTLLIDIDDNLTKYNEKMAYKYFDNFWR